MAPRDDLPATTHQLIPIPPPLRRIRRRGRTPHPTPDRGDREMTQTNNVGRTQRKSLSNEIDRLDGILDGLDEALAGSVETAVRDVVGQVVRETVEATVREVLSNPDLIRSAIAQHAPVATPLPRQPRKTLKEALKGSDKSSGRS